MDSRKKVSYSPLEYAMRRQIKGALKSCIADHGPITRELIGSVLKRLERQAEYQRLIKKDGQ